MADEIENPAPAPVVEQAAPAPEAPVEQNLAVETPAPEPVDTAEPVVAPAAEVVAEPTVLGDEPKKIEPKANEKPADAKPAEEVKAEEKPKEEVEAEEKKPEGEVKAEEAKAEEAEPVPLPTYEAWKFPEGIVADDERVGAINKVFGEFEQSAKIDHAAMQEFGQKMVDMHGAALKDQADRIQKAYQDIWQKQTTDWLDAFKKDPEIGGNRQETTTEAARQFIRTFGGTADQQAEVKDLFNKTGIGNHPAVIRLLANANLVKREGKPIPAQKAAPAVVSKIARRYGSNA